MKSKEFKKEYEEAQKISRQNVTKGKEKAKKLIDNADCALLLQTDKGGAFIGNKIGVSECLCNLFDILLEEDVFTKEELIDLLNIVDNKTKVHKVHVEAAGQTLDKLDRLLDKAIKLQELQNEDED